jgi:membrane protein required for colicin V production
MGGADFNMNGYDLAITVIFVFFVVRGIWVGLLRQVTVIIALYAGYIVAGQYHDRLFPFLRGVSDNPQILFLVACAILFVCVYVLTMLLGKALAGVVSLTIAGWFDKLLGAVLGGVKALIAVIVLHMLLTAFLPPNVPLLSNCQLCPYLSQATTYFQKVIKDDKVRQALQRKEPADSEQIIMPAAVQVVKPAPPASPLADQPAGKKTQVEPPVNTPLPPVQ